MEQSTASNYKFVVVLNKNLEPGRALNTASHMSACIVSQAKDDDRKKMFFVDYEDANGGRHPVSGLSLVVLKAKNSNEVRKVREKAKAEGILFVDFTESMTQGTYIEQMDRTKQIAEENLEYWGICLFGEKDKLNPITGKLSLWN